ncbi:MAG: TrmH family RNA methyltransferase [Myxococcota bacterium]
MSPTDAHVLERAKALGIPLQAEAARAMRRMSTTQDACSMVAMTGPPPSRSLADLMEAEGLVLLLAGLRYPGNVGFILRAAEVAGAAGVVIANDWEGEQLAEADRIGMHASRFFGVLESDVEASFAAAREAGRRIVAFETEGAETPWQNDWRAPTLAVIGGETEGLSPALVEACDAVLRIPTRGFIPSYNVQAAAGIALGEWLRQTAA